MPPKPTCGGEVLQAIGRLVEQTRRRNLQVLVWVTQSGEDLSFSNLAELRDRIGELAAS